MRGFWCAALALLMTLLPGHQAAEETIYLRVIGAGNSRLAQEEKLRVRDAVRCAMPGEGSVPVSSLPQLALAARKAGNGRVTLRCWQPPGEAPGITVYVELGAAAGHNWWGVLYPEALTLCGQRPARRWDAVEDRVAFSWPVLDWLAGLLGWKTQ